MSAFHRRYLRRACCRLCEKRLGAPSWTTRRARATEEAAALRFEARAASFAALAAVSPSLHTPAQDFEASTKTVDAPDGKAEA